MNENQNNNVMMGNYGPNNYQQKNNKSLIAVLIILLIISLCAVVYFAFFKNNNISIKNNEIDKEIDEREIINEEDIDNPSESEEEKEVEEEINKVTYNVYYVYTDKNNCKKDCDTPNYFELSLRDDGTYIYQHGTMQYAPEVGKYSINNDKVYLKPVIEYGSDTCFYRIENPKEKELKIEKNSLIIKEEIYDEDDNAKKEEIKLALSTGKDKKEKWYVINPVDGKKPKGYDEKWVDCSNSNIEEESDDEEFELVFNKSYHYDIRETVGYVDENCETECENKEDCDEDIYECDTSEYFDIIFKSDGTYIFQSGSYATMPTAGKYKKEGNKITLIPVVEYGSDACYYNINESNKIILNLTSEGIEFNNVVLVLTDIKIDNNYLSRYVVNPINGKIPEGWEEEWIDCTAEY